MRLEALVRHLGDAVVAQAVKTHLQGPSPISGHVCRYSRTLYPTVIEEATARFHAFRADDT